VIREGNRFSWDRRNFASSAPHVTQPIAHGDGVGHSRNTFLKLCVMAINGEI
jgi:hypothetical protein